MQRCYFPNGRLDGFRFGRRIRMSCFCEARALLAKRLAGYFENNHITAFKKAPDARAPGKLRHGSHAVLPPHTVFRPAVKPDPSGGRMQPNGITTPRSFCGLCRFNDIGQILLYLARMGDPLFHAALSESGGLACMNVRIFWASRCNTSIRR